MDPYAVLGLHPGASDEEVLAAFRSLAKRSHPDVGGGSAADAQMARLNVALAAIRSGGSGSPRTPAVDAPDAPVPMQRGRWLSDRIREALSPEVLAALEPGEDVRLITRASTWREADVLLVLTDRRLLWLAAQAIRPELITLRHADLRSVSHQVRRPLRRSAVVRLIPRAGGKVEFADLDPAAAALIARNVQQAISG